MFSFYYPLFFISIHALREEGDLEQRQPEQRRPISIHALREEGDRKGRSVAQRWAISIHALREEGDLKKILRTEMFSYFYPRPPRGGRQKKYLGKNGGDKYFYPRPPRGGRPVRYGVPYRGSKFLSTPSARRATRKR